MTQTIFGESGFDITGTRIAGIVGKVTIAVYFKHPGRYHPAIKETIKESRPGVRDPGWREFRGREPMGGVLFGRDPGWEEFRGREPMGGVLFGRDLVWEEYRLRDPIGGVIKETIKDLDIFFL